MNLIYYFHSVVIGDYEIIEEVCSAMTNVRNCMLELKHPVLQLNNINPNQAEMD